LATSSEDAPEAGSVARLRQPSGRSVAVDLQPGDTQTRDAVRLYRALPSEEFLDRQLVAAADFLMAPSRTALTTTALRRATQRFVSEGGKSTTAAVTRCKISSPVKLYSPAFSSMAAE